MPAEKFYLSGQVEGDGTPPDLVVSWGTDHDGGSSVKLTLGDDVYQIATPTNTKGLGRLLTALTRARGHMVQNFTGAPGEVRYPEMLQHDRTRLTKAPDALPDAEDEPNQLPHVFKTGDTVPASWLPGAPPLTVLTDTNGRDWKRSQRAEPRAPWIGMGHRGIATHEHLAERGPLTYAGTLGKTFEPEEAAKPPRLPLTVKARTTGMVRSKKITAGHTYHPTAVFPDASGGVYELEGHGENRYPVVWFVAEVGPLVGRSR